MQQMTNKFKNERGQTMTEFAFVVPILLVLLLGIVQFGIAFNNYVTLTDAVRAGARKAAVSRNNTDPESICKTAIISAASNLKRADLEPSLYCRSDWQPGSEVEVHGDYGYSINLLGWTVYSGRLDSTTKERVE